VRDERLKVCLQSIKGKGKMNIFGKTLVSLFLAAIMLASCSSGQSTPTVSDAEIMKTARATVSTALAETQPALPTPSPHLLGHHRRLAVIGSPTEIELY
jgi:hypothetical protein